MHLKRFDHRPSNATATVGVKVDDFVEFPVRSMRPATHKAQHAADVCRVSLTLLRVPAVRARCAYLLREFPVWWRIGVVPSGSIRNALVRGQRHRLGFGLDHARGCTLHRMFVCWL